MTNLVATVTVAILALVSAVLPHKDAKARNVAKHLGPNSKHFIFFVTYKWAR